MNERKVGGHESRRRILLRALLVLSLLGSGASTANLVMDSNEHVSRLQRVIDQQYLLTSVFLAELSFGILKLTED